MGLESLQGRRDKAKLKWLYKVACMEDDRYPHKLFRQFGILNHVEVARGSLGAG